MVDLYGNYSKFDWQGNLRKITYLLDTYNKLRVPQKTPYGTTTQTKKKYVKNNFKLYKWIRRNKYKWISNYYNYKLDYLVNAYVPQGATSVYFKSITESDESNYIYDLYRSVTTIAGTKLFMLEPLFDQMRISGVVVDYKANQIVKTNSMDNNSMPNLLFSILTTKEKVALGTFDDRPIVVQTMVDRPYSKIVAVDDDFRMYRPFREKKNVIVSDPGEQMLYSWIPVDGSIPNIYLVGLFTNSLPDYRDSRWDLGTIKVTLYIKLRNSRI